MSDFKYYRAPDLREALKILESERGGIWLLAGGTDLLVDIRAGKVKPTTVLDIGRLEELSGISIRDDGIWIGSGTRLAEIAASPLIERYAPCLSQAAAQMASPQVRNQATIGGNLLAAAAVFPCARRAGIPEDAVCDKCVRQCRKGKPGRPVYGDTVTALMALDGKIVLQSDGTSRELTSEEFVSRPATERRATEIVTAVQVPLSGSRPAGFYKKAGLRKAFSFSLINLSAAAECQDGYCTKVRLAVTQMGPTVRRLRSAEALLEGKRVNPDLIKEAASLAASEGEALSDVRASADYRSYLCRMLVREALETICMPGEA